MGSYRTLTAVTAMIACTVMAAAGTVFARGGVLNSPHNLSVSGGKGSHGIAYDEIRVCVFCHTPHNAINVASAAPLWNRALPPEGTPYSMYQSDTFNEKVALRPTAPTGASRICLSCHDGTLAMSSYGGPTLSGGHSGASPATMPGDATSASNPNLTTDLSDDHPISFAYTADLAARANLVDPAGLPREIKLDQNGDMQCTACHDPHSNEFGNFLVMNNGDPAKPGYNPAVTSPLCVACHTPPGWDASSPHYAESGCLNCHMSHGAPVRQYLLSAPLDQLCFGGTGCHGSSEDLDSPHQAVKIAFSKALSVVVDPGAPAGGGQVAVTRGIAQPGSNLESVFNNSPYKHPVGLYSAPYKKNAQLPLRQARVECVDCHNSHVAGSSSPMAGNIKKSLKKVTGISKDTLGSVEAGSEYQICYKCHSGPFAFKFVGVRKPNRVIAEPDQMKRFDVANPSFHPVAALRRGNGDSLLEQYQSSMLGIACSDCHNSDQGKKAGGSGPDGPHGSRYEHILLARYEMPVKGAETRAASCSGYRSDYALCFTCHSEDYVMIGGTSFMDGTVNEHASHVVDRCIPCFACHDPHGVPVQDGATGLNNVHLINFDRSYASSQSIPVPRYTSISPGTGSCTVSCHSGEGTRSYSR